MAKPKATMHSIVQAAVMKLRAREQAGIHPLGLAGGASLTAGAATLPPCSTSPPMRACQRPKAPSTLHHPGKQADGGYTRGAQLTRKRSKWQGRVLPCRRRVCLCSGVPSCKLGTNVSDGRWACRLASCTPLSALGRARPGQGQPCRSDLVAHAESKHKSAHIDSLQARRVCRLALENCDQLTD